MTGLRFSWSTFLFLGAAGEAAWFRSCLLRWIYKQSTPSSLSVSSAASSSLFGQQDILHCHANGSSYWNMGWTVDHRASAPNENAVQGEYKPRIAITNQDSSESKQQKDSGTTKQQPLSLDVSDFRTKLWSRVLSRHPRALGMPTWRHVSDSTSKSALRLRRGSSGRKGLIEQYDTPWACIGMCVGLKTPWMPTRIQFS